jgi:hypothetical protein
MFLVLWEVFGETGDISYFKSLFKCKLVREDLIRAIEVINNPHEKLQDLLFCLREFNMYNFKA